MLQAITTKYLGPTNYRGGRIVATCEAGKITVNWNYGLNVSDNHKAAMQALASKLDWLDGRKWYYGGTEDGAVGVQV